MTIGGTERGVVPLTEATVDAVYLAMLGRPADPQGRSFWTASSSVQELISALRQTERHQERMAALASAGNDDLNRIAEVRSAGDRMLAGDGQVALGGALGVLDTLPWAEASDEPEAPPALALGPYARELAVEVVARGLAAACTAGLSSLEHEGSVRRGPGPARTGTLLLTDGRYPQVLAQLRPDVLSRCSHKVLHPVQVRAGTPADERAATITAARRALHRWGFLEVGQVVGRRFGGGTVVLDRTHSTPDLGELHHVAGAALPGTGTPDVVWLVGRRVPTRDRS